MEIRTVKQSQLSAECWLIQFRGAEACKSCECKNSAECGGKKIRKTGKNEKGFEVPLGKAGG